MLALESHPDPDAMALGTAAELDFMLRDSGVPVVYGAPAQNTYGQLDRGEILVEGQAPMQLRDGAQTLVIREGSLADLRNNRQITIDGVAYTITDIGVADTEGWRRLTVIAGAP